MIYLNCRVHDNKRSAFGLSPPRAPSHTYSCPTLNSALPAWLIFKIWFSGEVAGHWSASKAAFVFLKLVKIILGSRVTVTLSSGCSEGMRSDSLTSLVSECSLPFAGQGIWNWEWACFLLDFVPFIGKCIIFWSQIENSITKRSFHFPAYFLFCPLLAWCGLLSEFWKTTVNSWNTRI